jgi:predicted enzyme involved in methoxymalonyl-ACP biosynthesis
MNKISFLSNIVTNPFDRYFEEFECLHFEINNIAQILTKKVDSDYLVLILDVEYFSFNGFLSEKSVEKFEELLELLSFFRKNNNTKIIVSNVTSNYLDINTTLNIKEYQKVLDLNSKINKLAEISDIAILNVYHLTLLHGYKNFINLKNGFLFQAPWTKLAYSVVAGSINENIELFQASRKKVLILDADNTLWGGIVGENGVDNIDIDENYPGVIFRHFQQQLKYLQKSGVLLALASKNNFNDVKEVFEKRDMPLKWNDFIVK